MTTRERIRVKTGVPVASDFDSPLGTPIVIDDTAGSGGVYYLDSSGAVIGIVGLGTSPTFSGVVTASRFVSTVATGTSPYSCTSTTLNTNLNADLLDGQHGSYYQSASNLNAGTVPDARFPATLPAASGANLTALNATQLTSGTVPDARFPSPLPTLSGVNLTALNATQLTSGTVPDGRFSTRVNSSPTVTAGSGTFTTVSASLDRQRVGDSMLWNVTVTITTNGTAATQINVAMPFTAAYECVGAGRECASAGFACTGTMNASSSTLQIVKYDNTYPGADGYRLTLSGRAFLT